MAGRTVFTTDEVKKNQDENLINHPVIRSFLNVYRPSITELAQQFIDEDEMKDDGDLFFKRAIRFLLRMDFRLSSEEELLKEWIENEFKDYLSDTKKLGSFDFKRQILLLYLHIEGIGLAKKSKFAFHSLKDITKDPKCPSPVVKLALFFISDFFLVEEIGLDAGVSLFGQTETDRRARYIKAKSFCEKATDFPSARFRIAYMNLNSLWNMQGKPNCNSEHETGKWYKTLGEAKADLQIAAKVDVYAMVELASLASLCSQTEERDKWLIAAAMNGHPDSLIKFGQTQANNNPYLYAWCVQIALGRYPRTKSSLMYFYDHYPDSDYRQDPKSYYSDTITALDKVLQDKMIMKEGVIDLDSKKLEKFWEKEYVEQLQMGLENWKRLLNGKLSEVISSSDVTNLITSYLCFFTPSCQHIYQPITSHIISRADQKMKRS